MDNLTCGRRPTKKRRIIERFYVTIKSRSLGYRGHRLRMQVGLDSCGRIACRMSTGGGMYPDDFLDLLDMMSREVRESLGDSLPPSYRS